jgi:hypothetical protein
VLTTRLREIPRRSAVIVIAIAVVVVTVVIVLSWSSGKSGSTAAFCSTVRTGPNPLEVFDQYDPTNVATARDQLQPGVDRLRAWQRAAPGEISGDLQLLVSVAQQLVAALDPTVTNKTIPDFTSEFDRVRTASANVTKFAADNCGVQLDTGTSATAATLPATSASAN